MEQNLRKMVCTIFVIFFIGIWTQKLKIWFTTAYNSADSFEAVVNHIFNICVTLYLVRAVLQSSRKILPT